MNTSNSSNKEKNSSNILHEIIFYLNVTLYALCYQLKKPIEPFLISELNAEDAVLSYGALQSFFSIIQTIGSPMMGVIIDRTSSKTAFFIAFLASAVSYGILSIATSLPLLYLSVLPTAFQHGFLVAQAMATNIYPKEEQRAAALGRLTAAYCIGATIGPSVGGYLGVQKDYYYGAKLACVGSILSCMLTLIGPGGKAQRRKLSNEEEVKKASFFKGLTILKEKPQIKRLIGIKLIISCSNGMMGAAGPLILKDFFKFNEQDLGYYFSISYLMTTLFSATTSKYLWNAFESQSRLVKLSTLVVIVGFALEGLVISTNEALYWLVSSIITSLGGHALAIFVTTMTTSLVDVSDRGALVGLEHGIFSVSRVVTPGIGVFILQYGGCSAVGFACAIWACFALYVDV